MGYKKTILIDLDGVLNNYTHYEENNIPSIKDGAKEFKIPAYMYIDDRAIQFNGNFEQLYKDIINFKVYWK